MGGEMGQTAGVLKGMEKRAFLVGKSADLDREKAILVLTLTISFCELALVHRRDAEERGGRIREEERSTVGLGNAPEICRVGGGE